jgi:hypothetical protein
MVLSPGWIAQHLTSKPGTLTAYPTALEAYQITAPTRYLDIFKVLLIDKLIPKLSMFTSDPSLSQLNVILLILLGEVLPLRFWGR